MTGSPPPVTRRWPSVAASKAGVDAMLAALAASRTSHAAVLAGLADAAKAAACGKDRRRSNYRAVVHLHRGDSRPDICWDSADHGRQRRRQQGVLASPTARTRATADRRRLVGAGTDHRRCSGRLGSRATRRTHADPLARCRLRSEAVVGIERAHDHRRRPGLAVAVHRRTMELPARRRRHRTDSAPVLDTTAAARALVDYALEPAARTTSPSQ